MRVSEALMLGSSMLKPVAGTQDDGHGGGCALGMIWKGAGGKWNASSSEFFLQTVEGLPLPCQHENAERLMGSGCQDVLRSELYSISHYLVHLFNYHVMTVKDWTIEQLADWIESLESKDEKILTNKEEVHEELASTVAR